jgi:hypothetical protein
MFLRLRSLSIQARFKQKVQVRTRAGDPTRKQISDCGMALEHVLMCVFVLRLVLRSLFAMAARPKHCRRAGVRFAIWWLVLSAQYDITYHHPFSATGTGSPGMGTHTFHSNPRRAASVVAEEAPHLVEAKYLARIDLPGQQQQEVTKLVEVDRVRVRRCGQVRHKIGQCSRREFDACSQPH